MINIRKKKGGVDPVNKGCTPSKPGESRGVRREGMSGGREGVSGGQDERNRGGGNKLAVEGRRWYHVLFDQTEKKTYRVIKL